MRLEIDIPDNLVPRWLAMTRDLGGSVKPVEAIPFRIEGGFWRIGDSTFGDLVGFHHIAETLRHRKVSVLDLVEHGDVTLAANRVAPVIRRARQALEEHEPSIADHLATHLTVGHYLGYSGDFNWDL